MKNFRPNFLLQLCQGLRDTDRCHWPWPASPGAPTLTPGRWPEDLFNLQLFAWPALGFSWILALLYFLAVAWCLLEALWELLSPGFARGISLCLWSPVAPVGAFLTGLLDCHYLPAENAWFAGSGKMCWAPLEFLESKNRIWKWSAEIIIFNEHSSRCLKLLALFWVCCSPLSAFTVVKYTHTTAVNDYKKLESRGTVVTCEI